MRKLRDRFNAVVRLGNERYPMAVTIGKTEIGTFSYFAAYQEGKRPPRYPLPAKLLSPVTQALTELTARMSCKP